jgi:hypothetical protein
MGEGISAIPKRSRTLVKIERPHRLSLLALPLLAAAPVALHAVTSAWLAPQTPVELRLKNTLSSADAKLNDRVEFEVTEDVKVGDIVAIPAGSLAWGVVSEASPRGRLLKSGRLSISIRAVCLASGERAPLRGDPSGRPRRESHEADEPSSNILALPALPVLLFAYGKDITIPEGRTATAFIAQGVNLDASRLENRGPNTTCDRDTSLPVTSAEGLEILSSVSIRSTPPGAEVTVDGRYAGNAPSTLKLPAGDHVLTVTAAGHKTWERRVRLTPGGDTNIVALLDPRQPLIRTATAPPATATVTESKQQ